LADHHGRDGADQPYRGDTIEADALPIQVCAWTSCFRSKQAPPEETPGNQTSASVSKVELFKFTRPETAMASSKRLLARGKILQKLGIHYRVVQLCTGDLGFASAKTFDMKLGFLPPANSWRFRPAPTAKRSRRAAPAFVSNRKAVRATSCIRLMVQGFQSPHVDRHRGKLSTGGWFDFDS